MAETKLENIAKECLSNNSEPFVIGEVPGTNTYDPSRLSFGYSLTPKEISESLEQLAKENNITVKELLQGNKEK
jgi:hypothetical protein